MVSSVCVWSGLSLSWAAAAAGHQKEVGGQTDGRQELGEAGWELGAGGGQSQGRRGGGETQQNVAGGAHTHTRTHTKERLT